MKLDELTELIEYLLMSFLYPTFRVPKFITDVGKVLFLNIVKDYDLFIKITQSRVIK